jgi:integrase
MAIRKTAYGYQVDLSVNGSRFKKTFKLRDEARDFERELLIRKKGEVTSSPLRRMSVQLSIEEYKRQFTSNKSQGTQSNENKYFEQFSTFLDSIGITHVHDIELQHLQKLQKHLSLRGISGATVNRQFNTYKHFISQCRLWKAIPHDPCFGLAPMKFTEKKKALWKNEEIWRVHQALKVQWQKDAFYFCATTGLRPGEICRLEWKDVDLEGKTIIVTTFKGDGRGRVREFPLTDDQIEKLKDIKKNSEGRFQRYVFVNRHRRAGQRIHLTNKITELAKKFGIKGRLYGVKHTLASNLRAQGTDIETIRQVLGHENLNTTQRYLQNLETHDVVREAMEAVHKKMR